MAVHHIGVFTDPLRSEPAGTRECAEMGAWGFVYGGGVGTTGIEMPAGVAMQVDNGLPLILQIHYVNVSDQPVTSSTTVVLNLAAPDETTQPAGSWIVGALDFTLPPNQRTDVQTTCTTHPRMEHVFTTFPHMHRLGTSLSVAVANATPAPIVDIPRWDFGNQGMWPVSPAMTIDQDAPLQTRCSFNNVTNAPVQFGLHTSDEMCVAVLYYWPATVQQGLALCDH
jgi:hypothetical protein